ncbi:MAG: TonB-dependent receptor [Pirellulales bacterium]|nr:TonB-dependent receptor [Pirellulales bacterium]
MAVSHAAGTAWDGKWVSVGSESGPVSPAPDASAGKQKPTNSAGESDDLGLLDMNLGELSKVQVRTGQPTNLNAPSTEISAADIGLSDASTTGGLARLAPSVSTRRLSGINLDPQVRGYHAGQLVATANGMNEIKTRLDIDSLLSQIDPGIVENITVIDGPYSSLYGPGFAFLNVDLLPVPRYLDGLESHHNTSFLYGTNGQTLYVRENVLAGGKDWGARFSYGLRHGNDYSTGGSDSFRIPSSYEKWDGLFAVSADLSDISRLEFDYIHCEMNNVELPGVVYDLNNSTNNQFNLTYTVQQDPKGPKDLVCQSWFQQTRYHGDALHPSKQESLYYQFFTLPGYDEWPVNTQGRGFSDSMGTRFLRTFGDRDSVQLTVGIDWRRYRQYYREVNLSEEGEIILGGGDVYGIPRSHMDDFGLLTEVLLPYSDTFSVTVGGRLDYCNTWLNRDDPVITQFADPSEAYYAPGLSEPSNLLGMAYVTTKTKLSERTTFNTGYAFAMRMPELAELYSDDPWVPFARFGNSYYSGLSELRPEKDLQFDVGLTTVGENVTYGVRGFFSLIWDYIMPVPGFIDYSPPGFIAAPSVLGRDFSYFVPEWREDLVTGNVNADTNQAGYQYMNMNLATLGGGDLFCEVRCREWLSVYGSMAYVRGTNWNPVVYLADDSWEAANGTLIPIGHREGLPYIYPLNGTVAFRFHDANRERWLMEFSSRLVAHQTNVAESLSEVPTAGFAVFALRGYFQPRQNLRLTAAIENLFDKYYVEPGSLAIIGPDGLPIYMPEPGITLNLGLDMRF